MKITTSSKKAFTLAEVLITLTIIGIVASLTISPIIKNVQDQELKTSAKNAYSTLNNGLKRAVLDNGNSPISCFYWAKKPYPSAKCKGYNANGDCTGWTYLDGSPLPSDYNGYFSECSKLIPDMLKNMVVSKKCSAGHAITDGCIPEYRGSDTVYMDANSGKSQVDANMATSGCSGWRTSNFNNKEAVVLNNGMVIIPYPTLFANSPIIAVDTNGRKGPNKAGYDVLPFYTKGTANGMAYYPGGCEYVEKGGHTASYYLGLTSY